MLALNTNLHGQHLQNFDTNIKITSTRPGATSTPLILSQLIAKPLNLQTLVWLPRNAHNARSLRNPLSIMASATGIPAVPAPKAPATPVEPLNTDIARLYTHIHPLVVLSLYAYKFNDLVADPARVLLGTLLPVAVLQIAYVAVCLPPTSGTSSAPQIKKQKTGDKKKAAPGKLEQGIKGTIVVRSLTLA